MPTSLASIKPQGRSKARRQMNIETSENSLQPNAMPQGAGALRSALIGAVLGVDATGHCLALATICFAGGLSGGLGLATSLFLFGSAVITLVLVAFSRFRVSLGIAQDTSVAILAPAVGFAALGVVGPDSARVATGLAVIAAATLLSGIAFWGIGRLGWGRLVRLFPYPVAAGFLASSGALLVLAALMIVTGASSYAAIPQALGAESVRVNLLPTVVMAATMVATLRFWQGSTPILIVIFAFTAGFYAVLWGMGLTRADAVGLHLLPQIGTGDGVRLGLGLIAQIDWGQVAVVAPTLAAVVLINLIGLLLNISGVELATQADIDVNRELRITGLANMAIAGAGGLTSYLQGGATVIANRLGAAPWPMGLAYGAVTLTAMLLAPQIAAAVPTFITAAMLMFIGFSMLEDWLIRTARQLIRADFAIVAGIVVLAIVIGILPAIAAGIGLAVVSFAFGYARIPVIRLASDAASQPGIVERAPAEEAVLQAQGQRIAILHLQGALFFGSVEKLIEQIGTLTPDHAQMRSLILDFADVISIDSAACAALNKLGYLMRRRGIALHVAQIPPQFAPIFARWGLELTAALTAGPNSLTAWTTLDAARDYAENDLLAQVLGPASAQSVFDLMTGIGAGHPRIAAIIAMMEQIDLPQGATLIHSGAPSDAIYVLERGHLSVTLVGASGQRMRVRSMAAGAIVGELGYLLGLPRTADVTADVASRVYRLGAAAMAQIDSEDRDLAAVLHAALARALAQKVIHSNRLLTHSQRGQGH